MKNVCLFLALLILTGQGFAQNRGLKLIKPPVENMSNEKRKAMVIGMSDYGANRSLENTLNDADDIADVFTRLGFEVTLLKNNDLRNLTNNLTAWYKTIERNDMAVFYFAGHGLELEGQNYLIPVDAEMSSQTDVRFSTLNVNQVLGNMEEKGVVMKLIILDACRDNPFKRSWNLERGKNAQGLAGMEAPKGTYIAFAASPGATAQDGGKYNLRNGVFTHFLKQELLKVGATIDEIFNNVTGDVADLTHEQQTPFRNSSLRANYYFIPRADNPPPNKPASVIADNPPPNNPAPKRTENPPSNKPASLSVAAIAKIVRQADAHYNNKRYNDAAPLYRQAAEQGHAQSQYRLGVFYENGNGVVKDYDQAIQWYTKAAEQGYASAQCNLGVFYRNGYGVTKDDKQGVEWYRKAAEQGHAQAQNNLGYCYENGYGVTKDYNQAAQWYAKAAEQGLASAQTVLGWFYQNGYGVTQDKDQAVYWYKKAADQGNETAKTMIKLVEN